MYTDLLPEHFFIGHSQSIQEKGHTAGMARTPKMAQDKREQIIDGALRVFAEKGFVRATNREIARESGNITPGLIYYYFKNKEDLLKVVLEERCRLPVTTQVQLEQPPDGLLPLVVGRLLAEIESERFLSILRMLLPEMLHETTELSPIVSSYFQHLTAFLNHALHIQAETGTLRADLNPSTTAQLIASGLIGMVLRRQIMRDPNVQECTHEELVHALLVSVPSSESSMDGASTTLR